MYLTLLFIILEISIIGLCFTKSLFYLIAIFASTISINLAIYGLFILIATNKHKLHHEYNFYYINHEVLEDKLYNMVRERF